MSTARRIPTDSLARKESIRWSGCPQCKVAASEPCRKHDGTLAKEPHDSRVFAAAAVLEAAHPKKYTIRYVDNSEEDLGVVRLDWLPKTLQSPLVKEIECNDCHLKFYHCPSGNGQISETGLQLHRLTCCPGRVTVSSV